MRNELFANIAKRTPSLWVRINSQWLIPSAMWGGDSVYDLIEPRPDLVENPLFIEFCQGQDFFCHAPLHCAVAQPIDEHRPVVEVLLGTFGGNPQHTGIRSWGSLDLAADPTMSIGKNELA